MKIGITGAKGFIGLHLSNLLQIDHEVIEYDGDVCDFEPMRCFFHKCDRVIHLAGKNRGDSKKLFVTNVLGTYNASKCAEEYCIPLLITGSDYSKSDLYKDSKSICSLIAGRSMLVDEMTLQKVIGKNCKPFYNSFLSTMFYMAAKGQDYRSLIDDWKKNVSFVKVEDVCQLCF